MLHDLLLTCYYLAPWLLSFSAFAIAGAYILERIIDFH